MLLSIPLILSNGMATTLLIPPIRELTTDLNTEAIPAFIPENTFPPVLNTSFTACQALLNVSLNQPDTCPKLPFIPFQTFLKNAPGLLNMDVRIVR